LKDYEVNRKRFNQKWNDFRKNPMSSNEQFLLMNPQITNFKSYDENGNEIDANAFKKAGREKARKNLVKNNNFLDLDLYK
jgi:hypothetical protein